MSVHRYCVMYTSHMPRTLKSIAPARPMVEEGTSMKSESSRRGQVVPTPLFNIRATPLFIFVASFHHLDNASFSFPMLLLTIWTTPLFIFRHLFSPPTPLFITNASFHRWDDASFHFLCLFPPFGHASVHLQRLFSLVRFFFSSY